MGTEKEMVPEAAAPGSIVARYFKAMPVVFPLVGLFLLGLAAFEAWNYMGANDVSPLYKLRPLVLLLYFVTWAGACLRWKKPSLAFLVLTIINVAFYLFGPDILLKRALGDILFIPLPVNILFCFLLLFYFRRLQ